MRIRDRKDRLDQLAYFGWIYYTQDDEETRLIDMADCEEVGEFIQDPKKIREIKDLAYGTSDDVVEGVRLFIKTLYNELKPTESELRDAITFYVHDVYCDWDDEDLHKLYAEETFHIAYSILSVVYNFE